MVRFMMFHETDLEIRRTQSWSESVKILLFVVKMTAQRRKQPVTTLRVGNKKDRISRENYIKERNHK